MTTPLDAKQMDMLLKPFIERHLSENDKAAVKAKMVDRGQTARHWDGMLAEAYALMKTGDPTSAASQDLARRWSTMSEEITADNPTIKAQGRAIWDDAMKDPAIASRMALNREILAFVRQAIEHWKTGQK